MSSPTPDVLYHTQYWSSSRVAQLIRELDLPSTAVKVETITEATVKTDPDLTSKNVQKCLPYFEDNTHNFSMVESGAIMSYICEKYDKDNRLSRDGKDMKKRAEWLQWLHYGPGTMYHIVVPVFMGTFGKEEDEWDKKLIEKKLQEWNSRVVPLLTKGLSDGRKFICGEEFSAADCSIGYDLMTASFTPFAETFIGKDGVIKEYLDRLKERDSWKALYA